MKILVSMFMLIPMIVCCQTDTISVYGGTELQFYQGNQGLRTRDVRNLLKENPEAYEEFKLSLRKRAIGWTVSITGAVVMGGGLGLAFAGQYWAIPVALVGILTTIYSYKYHAQFATHIRRAIRMYNKELLLTKKG